MIHAEEEIFELMHKALDDMKEGDEAVLIMQQEDGTITTFYTGSYANVIILPARSLERTGLFRLQEERGSNGHR